MDSEKNHNRFYAHGKLLLTGEYLILDGALGLAIPTRFGQDLVIENGDHGLIHWQSLDENGEIWFESRISLPVIVQKQDTGIEKTLKKILQFLQYKNPLLFSISKGYKIKTHLEFPRFWGLGSSSTLLYNLAQWAQVDPFELLKETLGGSGYDIACAGSPSPILYQLQKDKPIIKSTEFNPSFSEQIFFVYTNKKQKSNREIIQYHKNKKDVPQAIDLINNITQLILKTNDVEDFKSLLKEHEKVMSWVLGRPTIQTQFTDYQGQLKSLGAWGGDFIMAVGNENTERYFKSKGYSTILNYNDMVL
jgi:mevalonate kinase